MKDTVRTECSSCERELTELRLLYEISALLAEPSDMKCILAEVLAVMERNLGISRGLITILNRSNGEIEIETALGYGSGSVERGRYRPGEGIIGRVIETGNPIAIPRIADEPLFLDRTGARKGLDTSAISFVCVPIKTGSEVIGSIAVDSPYLQKVPLERITRVLAIIASSISQAVRLRQVAQEEVDTLRAENERLQSALKTRNAPEGVIGNSKIMRDLYAQIEQVSATNATVLLLGESGVGKERIAHAIHFGSPRSEKPFVKLNCAAIPESLIESELFGHEKGAFTNATERRKGKFELANGGTIFLDEIGEMPLSLQSKFLRVLQEREFERVGGSECVRVDFRVIAATNRDLPSLIAAGRFREDLYYRLNVFPMVVPPLRERKTDIVLLADHFTAKFAKAHWKTIKRISSPAMSLLMAHDWPGNVRELENCIERAVILSTDGVIHAFQLPPSLQGPGRREGEGSGGGTLTEIMAGLEKGIIEEELRKNGGNLSRAAKSLGITERIMGLRAKKYGIKPKGEGNGTE